MLGNRLTVLESKETHSWSGVYDFAIAGQTKHELSASIRAHLIGPVSLLLANLAVLKAPSVRFAFKVERNAGAALKAWETAGRSTWSILDV